MRNIEFIAKKNANKYKLQLLLEYIMAKFSETPFCPAPWSQIYYHLNSPSPCHIIRNHHLNMTPEEYLASDWLKNVKKDMMEGRVPTACQVCKKKEDLGMKSTRGAAWEYFNVGPEPEYETRWFSKFNWNENSPTEVFRVELRFSNLCNMKCRMCDETSSSEWAKEKLEHNMEFLPINKSMDRTESIIRTKYESVEGLKQVVMDSKVFNKVCFTGGEPLLIKEYYEFLDFLIDNNMSHRVQLELYTNCSVYNPLFIDRIMKFQSVEFIMSIDGVGKTAEYIRAGTDWSKVEKNIRLFNALPAPIKIEFNTAISSYALLDVSSLAEFLMSLYRDNNNIQTKCYHVIYPRELHYSRLDGELKQKAIEEIEKALKILTVPNFLIFATELANIKKKLVESYISEGSELFCSYTQQLDQIRNESFEDTFGISLDKNC